MALPTAGMLSVLNSGCVSETGATPAKKNISRVAGVQIGLNVPYSFSNPAMSGDEVLRSCLQVGVGAVELRAQPVEAFLGVPANLVGGRRTAAAGEAAVRAAPVYPAAAKANAEALRKWRTSWRRCPTSPC